MLSDIHGNIGAFEAGLADAREQGADGIVICGDVVGGSPDSAACWELARSLGCPILRGNHERYVADFGTDRAPALWSTPQFAPLRWTVESMPAAAIEQMRAMPTFLRVPGLDGVLFTHGSPRSDADSIYPHTPEEALPPMFAGHDEPLIVRAHNHLCNVRVWGERVIVSNGALGLPLDCHAVAQYLLMTRTHGRWSWQFRGVAYDVEAAVRRFRDTGYLQEGGVMAYLFMRELQTASHQVVPFLRMFARWRETEPDLGLDDGLARFLR